MKWLQEIFQDIDGGYSAKRTAFFIFIFLFVILVIVILFRPVDAKALDFLHDVLDKVTDLIKWLGGFIVAERVQLFGKKDDGHVGGN
jgi:hypothetical protein